MPEQHSEQFAETDIATLQEVWRTDARTDLSFFCEYVSRGRWIPARHLVLIASIIEERIAQGGARIILTVPPRHGKSWLVSKHFPAWLIGNNPDKRVILTAYEASFAAFWGGQARDILEEWGKELFDITLKHDSTAKAWWGVDGHEGGMVTAGIGGPITGKGADVLIVDDPVKSAAEANSEVYREKTWEWFNSTAYTRLEPSGSCIVIMTRWHEDDLAGRLIADAEKENGEKWEVINLPAIAAEDDPLGREPGKALWPARYDEAAFARIKNRMGSYWWASLYQQDPQAEDGEIFHRSEFRYASEDDQYYLLITPGGIKRFLKGDCWCFQTCDPAATEQESSDYFVLSTWVVTPEADLLLWDVFREKAETTKHEAILQTGLTRWRPSFQGVENKTYGLTLLQGLVKKGYPLRPLKADASKTARARTMAARYEVGAVYHREGAPWLTAYEDELIAFPRGKHDDMVDCAAYAAICLVEMAGDVYDEEFDDAVDFGGW